MKNTIILVGVLTVGINQLCASYNQKLFLIPPVEIKFEPTNLAQFYLSQRQLKKSEPVLESLPEVVLPESLPEPVLPEKVKKKIRWRDAGENEVGKPLPLTDKVVTFSRAETLQGRIEVEEAIQAEIKEAAAIKRAAGIKKSEEEKKRRLVDLSRVDSLLLDTLKNINTLSEIEDQRLAQGAALEDLALLPVSQGMQRHFLRQQLHRFNDFEVERVINTLFASAPERRRDQVLRLVGETRSRDLPSVRYLKHGIGKKLYELERDRRLKLMTLDEYQERLKSAFESDLAQGFRESLRKSIADPTFDIGNLKEVAAGEFFDEPENIQKDIQLLIDSSYQHVRNEWMNARANFEKTGQEFPEIQKYMN